MYDDSARHTQGAGLPSAASLWIAFIVAMVVMAAVGGLQYVLLPQQDRPGPSRKNAQLLEVVEAKPTPTTNLPQGLFVIETPGAPQAKAAPVKAAVAEAQDAVEITTAGVKNPAPTPSEPAAKSAAPNAEPPSGPQTEPSPQSPSVSVARPQTPPKVAEPELDGLF